MTGGGGSSTVAVPAGGTGSTTLTVGTTHVCQLPGRIEFATARSFVEPTADNRTMLRDIATFAASGNTHNQLLLVGHTDTTGEPGTNDPLSERRAEAVHALLIGDTAAWERLFATERWADPELTHLVVETGEADPSNPAAVAAAVAALRGSGAGAARGAIYRRYFDALLGRTGPPPITFVPRGPPHIGCGETHPLRGTPAAPTRNPADPRITGDFRPNRRVEAFFVETLGVSISLECADYPGWTLACSLTTPPPAVVDWFVAISLGTDAAGHGTSRTDPFRTIQFAVNHVAGLSTAGRDVIHVMDGTYAEVVSLADGIDLVADVGAAPVLRSALPGTTALKCIGVADVRIEGLTVQSLPAALVRSGGIAVSQSRDVTIDRCTVTGCLAARGGGILVEASTDVTINNCELTENHADRGGGVAIVGSTRVNLTNRTIEGNAAGTIATAVARADLDASFSLEISVFDFEVGDAHGGGVYLENAADARIVDNRIRENQAIVFGGGIAVDNESGFSGSLLIQGNEIVCNQVAHGGLGGTGVTAIDCSQPDMGDPVLSRLEGETIDRVAARAVRLLHGVGRETGLGGGVALRHVSGSTRLVDNQIGAARRPNRARRGGGVECYIGAYPVLDGNRIEHNLSSDDGGGVAIDQFDPFLPDSQPTFLGFRREPLVPRRPVRLVDNQISSNRTLEDGGGVYATGGALVEVTGGGTVVSDNRATENGGGIRVSYAVRLTVRGATLRNNTSNVDARQRDAGGGLAARNSEVTLEDCLFQGNVATAFAGGAAFFNSSFEGGFDAGGFIENRHGQFDEMQEDDHRFRDRTLTMRNCRGADNQATGASGAGGYLYAVRVPGTTGGAEALHVLISGSRTAIGANTSEYDNSGNPGGARQKRGNVVLELSGSRGGGGQPVDRVNIFGDVPAIPAGIALSTPTPDDRAVVVIHHLAGPTRPDDHDPAFPYANLRMSVIDIQPRGGAQAGGTPITITGEGFVAGLANVDIDGAPAGNVVVVSDTEITAETPPQPPPAIPGLVDVTVTAPDGQSETIVGGYEYRLPPTIVDVQPRSGTILGGDPVTIIGTEFAGGAEVEFGGVPAASVTVVSDTQITALTPPQSGGGFVDVEVRNFDGQSDVVALGFEYVPPPPPSIVDVQPRSGPAGATTAITITGSGFMAGAIVDIGGAAATSVVVVSDTQITAVTPPLAAGRADVVVTNLDAQSDIVADGFEFRAPPPQIVDVQPRDGSVNGGDRVAVTGSDFQPGAVVRFDGRAATAIAFVNSGLLEVDTPPLPSPLLPGPVDVEVENPDGQSDTVPGGFTYL